MDEADGFCVDSGPSKVIRRPRVDRLGIGSELKLLTRKYANAVLNPGSWEAETGRQSIPGQPGWHSQILYKITK